MANDKIGTVTEVPDDLFDESESPPGGVSASEDSADIFDDEEPEEPKKKKEKVEAASEEDEEDDIPDPTATQAAVDPQIAILAELRAQNAELMARLQGLEQRPVAAVPDKEEQEYQALVERKQKLRQAAKKAIEEGDDVTRQEASWELSDVEQELLRRDGEKQLAKYRQPSPQEKRSGLTEAQLDGMQAETFLRLNNVTREEQARMEREWERMVAAKPAWNDRGVTVWSRMDAALKLARKGQKSASSSRGSLVEGGQGAPQTSSNSRQLLPKESRLRAAAAFGMSLKDYDKMISDHRKGR